MFYKLYYWDSTSKYIIVETAALEAIKENPQAVADFKSGKEKALNSLVGAVMKKMKGRADARKVREVLLGRECKKFC